MSLTLPRAAGRRSPERALTVLLASLLIAGVVACSDPEPPEPSGEASADPVAGDPATEGVEGVVAVGGLSNDHVEGTVEYDAYPPLGGPHNPVWHNCGFVDEPIPNELAVHSMEHGAVWVAFAPDLPDVQVDVVRAAAEADDHVLAAPYPGLRSSLVLTAWGRQLDLDGTDDPRFASFIDTYVDSVAPEADAPCSGGAG